MKRGAVVATKLGPAFFANEDDTPFAIGRSLCGDPIEDAKTGRLDLSVFVEVADKSKELADKQDDAESAKTNRANLRRRGGGAERTPAPRV